LGEDAAGREEEGVFRVRCLGGWRVADGMEAGTAAGGGEAAGEEAGRAGVVLGRAGPEDAVLGGDLLVGDAGVVGGSAGAGAAQLFEDGAGVGEGEVLALAEPVRKRAEQPDIG